jgi:energy-converting hydrogenase Eha subunit H
MITHTYKDFGYFYVKFQDIVTFEDIVAYLTEFQKIDYLPIDLCLLYNLENVQLKVDIDNIPMISDLASKVTSKYKSIRTALVVTNPNNTAYSILFQSDSKPNKTKRKTFSTEEAAEKWLKDEC